MYGLRGCVRVPAILPSSNIWIWHSLQYEFGPKKEPFSFSLPVSTAVQSGCWKYQTSACGTWDFHHWPAKLLHFHKMLLIRPKFWCHLFKKGKKTPNKWIVSYSLSCNPSGQVCIRRHIHYYLLWLPSRTDPACLDPKAPCHALGS